MVDGRCAMDMAPEQAIVVVIGLYVGYGALCMFGYDGHEMVRRARLQCTPPGVVEWSMQWQISSKAIRCREVR